MAARFVALLVAVMPPPEAIEATAGVVEPAMAVGVEEIVEEVMERIGLKLRSSSGRVLTRVSAGGARDTDESLRRRRKEHDPDDELLQAATKQADTDRVKTLKNSRRSGVVWIFHDAVYLGLCLGFLRLVALCGAPTLIST